jgi:hypothetical protein
MDLINTIEIKQRQFFVGYIPNYDPYNNGRRQCCGRCPKQKYNVIKK